MKWTLTFLALISFINLAEAQSKLTAVTQIELTKTELPAGSRRDQRLLPVSVAKTLLEMVAEKIPGTVGEGTEVYVLPPATDGSQKAAILKSLEAGGWNIQALPDATDFRLSRSGQELVMYLTEGKREGGLYLAPVVVSVTDTKPISQESTVQTSNNTVVQQQNSTSQSQNQGQQVQSESQKNTVSGSSGYPPANGGTFAFTQTNFDDGWTSIPSTDKVIVSKGALRVFIYFGIPHNDESRGYSRQYCWERVVGKDFQILTTGYRDHGEVIAALQNPYVEGEAIEKATGRKVYVGMYAKSDNGIMFVTLAIANDMNALRGTFPKGEDQYESDLHRMRYYNRFAVGPSDLPGHWTESTGSSVNYYNAYSGNFAGTAFSAATNEFWFNADGTYKSKHAGGFGMVGDMKVYKQEYLGAMTLTPWTLALTKRWEGKTDQFHSYFEAISGGRVLHLQDQTASGITYALVRQPE